MQNIHYAVQPQGMMKRVHRQVAILGFVVAVLLVACNPVASIASPSQFLNLGDVRERYTFDDSATTWETFSTEGSEALFQVADSALMGAVIPNMGYVWSLSGTRRANVAIQVTVQQTQGASGNGFGVMCRADAVGNGYYFVISSAGQFAILKGSPRQIDPVPLVEWQSSEAIHPGTMENELLAVCTADYLSFSVNGQFLAEAYDDEFAAGELGMVLGAVGETAWVRFDTILVRDANLVAGR
ncbi:MAG: hypothetical protein H6671_09505 [Anaerolineaceae bacterium]|nr:hypothetical protein [Anaerolineaceae bacterium]